MYKSKNGEVSCRKVAADILRATMLMMSCLHLHGKRIQRLRDS